MFIPRAPHPTKSELLSNNVSQRKVAEAMGVSQAFISRYKTLESRTL
jgi:predicted transcriptional regulator|tara:strand:+ start:163 stop:303 length:141 start_codon:yes stop_codon:yes gene_type:complete